MRVRNFDPNTPSRRSAKSFKQIAHQNKRERDEQQKDQRRESGKYNDVLIVSRAQKGLVKGSLRNQKSEQEKDADGQQNDDLLAARGLLRRNGKRLWHGHSASGAMRVWTDAQPPDAQVIIDAPTPMQAAEGFVRDRVLGPTQAQMVWTSDERVYCGRFRLAEISPTIAS